MKIYTILNFLLDRNLIGKKKNEIYDFLSKIMKKISRAKYFIIVYPYYSLKTYLRNINHMIKPSRQKYGQKIIYYILRNTNFILLNALCMFYGNMNHVIKRTSFVVFHTNDVTVKFATLSFEKVIISSNEYR